MITTYRLCAVAGAVLAVFLMLFVLSADSARGATLYEQLVADTIAQTRDQHGSGNPIQGLGKGLSGTAASVVFKVSDPNLVSNVAAWYGGLLFKCSTTGYTSCTSVASDFDAVVQNTNEVLAVFTSSHLFSFDNYYYLFNVSGSAGLGALYGSAADVYPDGMMLWSSDNSIPTNDPDANVADIAFRICDTASCNLIPPDTTPPVLAGVPADSTIEATSASTTFSYTLPTATDAVDGVVSVSCSPVSGWGFSLGSTTVTCSTADAAGNATSSTFVIGVVDTTAPVVTLAGDAAVSLTVGDTFTDQGATATDPGAAVPVPTTGSVDTATAGTYTLTYSATDASGNTASTTRTITVTAPPPPPPPAPPAGGGGGGGVIGGPLSVGYQVPYLPPPPPPAPPVPTPPPAPEPLTPAPAAAQPKPPADVQAPAPVQNQTSDVQTPAVLEPTATNAKSPVAVITPWDRPLREQIPMGAAIATSGLQMPSYAAMAAALLLLTLGAAMALRHSKVV